MLRWFACSIVVLTACSESLKITIDPATATIVRNGTFQFHVVGTGGADTAVTWFVREGEAGGQIDATGKYTAPSSTGLFHVVAVAKVDPAAQTTAAVTVTADEVVLLSMTPASPANENQPMIAGTAAPGAHVVLHSTEDCSGAEIAVGDARDDGQFFIRLEVADDTTTVIRGTVTSERATWPCSASSLTYVEDSTPPGAPALTSVTPKGPSDNQAPVIAGTAEAQSTVEFYFEAGCEGDLRTSVRTDDKGVFNASVHVAADATTIISFRAVDAAGNASACSSSVSYTHQR